ncbi:MAG: GTP pyrophosphokinase family protein [Campylobacteraceae bacterium]
MNNIAQNKENILKDYDKNLQIYKDCEEKINVYLHDMLNIHKNEKINQIATRVKDKESLSLKIDRKEQYESIDDITDVLGARIVVYFDDDIEEIANIIKQEFVVDEEKSIDKRKVDFPDRFKYKSLHLIVSLKNERINFPGYSCFKNIKFEIQIRTIFQHGWAQIEHGLGYRNSELSGEYKRDFNRLSALLELADLEFMRIRNNILKYKNEAKNEILNNPNQVFIDKISLESFILNNAEIVKLDKFIAKNHSLNYVENHIININDKLIKILDYFNIKTIEELSNHFTQQENNIKKFTTELSHHGYMAHNIDIFKGSSLAYMCWCLVGVISDGEDDIKEHMKNLGVDFLNDEIVINTMLKLEKIK